MKTTNKILIVSVSFVVGTVLFGPIIFLLGCLGLLIYFAVSAIQFFKRKEINDIELLGKIDELIKWHTQQSDNRTEKE